MKYLVASTFGASTHGQQVTELIREFHRQSAYVVPDEHVSRRKLLEQVRARYGGELSPYSAAAKKLIVKLQKFAAFFAQQAARFHALAHAPHASASQRHWARRIGGAVDTLGRHTTRWAAALKRTLRATLPHWQTVMQRVKSGLGVIRDNLKVLTSVKAGKHFGKGVHAYLAAQGAIYQKMMASAVAARKQITALKPLKLSNVRSMLGPDSMVVMGPKKVKIIPVTSLFEAPPPAAQQQGAVARFKGEEELASALLAMSQRRQPKIVFIAPGLPDVTGPQSPFTTVVHLLKQNNFKVMSWSPPNPQTGPQPGQTPLPQAMGKGVTWVVFAPPPPNPQMPMPSDNAQLVGLVKKQLAQGGGALFLLDGMAANPMMGMAPPYPFTGILRQYGIALKPGYFTVERYPARGGKHVAAPELQISHFPKTRISAPLQTLSTAFEGMAQGNMVEAGPTYVGLTKAVPGVVAHIFVQTPKSPDIWAETQSTSDRFNAHNDLASPIPLAAMARRGDTRVAAIGNTAFIYDALVNIPQIMSLNGQPVLAPRFPGNTELFLNTIRWLAGYQNMIAVSPRATVALRIGPMGGHSMLVRWASVLTPSALVVALGIGVFMVRRRS